MFKKLETWFRTIIAEEVTKVKVDAQAEGERVTSFISVHTKSATNSIEAEVLKLASEFEGKVREDMGVVFVEKLHLIKELQERLHALQGTVAKFSPPIADVVCRWKTDEETLQADHALKLVKQ